MSINDAAAKRDFYSDRPVGPEETVDDLITRLENDLAPLVAVLNGVKLGEPIHSSIPAAVISHLYMRSASLRSLLRESHREIHLAMAEWIASAEFLPRFFGVDKTFTNPRFRELLSVLRKDSEFGPMLSLLPGRGPKAEILIFSFVRSRLPLLGERAVSELLAKIQAVERFGPDWARDSHGKALRNHLDDDQAMMGLKDLTWTVEAVRDVPLPDTIAIASKDGRTFEALPWIRASDRAIAMFPISADRMVVGRGSSAIDLPTDIPSLMAAASDDFFVTDGELASLEIRDLIGLRTRTLMDEIIEETKNALLREPLANHFGRRER